MHCRETASERDAELSQIFPTALRQHLLTQAVPAESCEKILESHGSRHIARLYTTLPMKCCIVFPRCQRSSGCFHRRFRDLPICCEQLRPEFLLLPWARFFPDAGLCPSVVYET